MQPTMKNAISYLERAARLSPEKRARLIETLVREASPPVATGMPSQRARSLALSYAQERLWFLDQLLPGNPFYNIAGAVRVGGAALDIGALEASFNEVVRRHEALRTRFEVTDGKPEQVVERELKLKIAEVDLSGLGGEERGAEVARLAREEAGKPFELSRGPLLRVTVLRLGEGEHVVLTTMHHIVSDGWSMGVLVREMLVLYEAYRQGQPSPLPELAIQYADYAMWQREWLRGEVLEEQLGYWRERLRGELPVLELPSDHARPAVQSYRGATLGFELSQGVAARHKE